MLSPTTMGLFVSSKITTGLRPVYRALLNKRWPKKKERQPSTTLQFSFLVRIISPFLFNNVQDAEMQNPTPQASILQGHDKKGEHKVFGTHQIISLGGATSPG